MYKNSSNTFSQLKSLFVSLQEFETKSIKPKKSMGTRWLGHKVRGMTKLNDKFGVYATLIKNAIEDKKCASANRAVLQGKLNALKKGRCHSSKCLDFLDPVKTFHRKSSMTS